MQKKIIGLALAMAIIITSIPTPVHAACRHNSSYRVVYISGSTKHNRFPPGSPGLSQTACVKTWREKQVCNACGKTTATLNRSQFHRH